MAAIKHETLDEYVFKHSACISKLLKKGQYWFNNFKYQRYQRSAKMFVSKSSTKQIKFIIAHLDNFRWLLANTGGHFTSVFPLVSIKTST